MKLSSDFCGSSDPFIQQFLVRQKQNKVRYASPYLWVVEYLQPPVLRLYIKKLRINWRVMHGVKVVY